MDSAVTADEELGFLPGSEKDKLSPLLAPMLDSIDKILGPGAWVALQNAHMLEMQSFAYMRGRTHERAFVIADEVQNASFSQLKLLATHARTLDVVMDESRAPLLAALKAHAVDLEEAEAAVARLDEMRSNLEQLLPD